MKIIQFLFGFGLAFTQLPVAAQQPWQSKHLQLTNNKLVYTADEKGNTIPDFSEVGYQKGKEKIPMVQVVKTLHPVAGNNHTQLQQAIDEVAKMPLNKNGFRGAILLSKGVYSIAGTLKIKTSGIVIRGEGSQTKLIAAGTTKHDLINVSGQGKIEEVIGTRKKIVDAYVPTGAKSFSLQTATGLKVGDRIILYRPATQQWIHDLKMDSIDAKENTVQWTPQEYDLHFERQITRIIGNQIFIDYPVVMALDAAYGGGEIYQYHFDGRIKNVGIENLLCESAYATEDDENHGWNAIQFNRIEDGWIRNVEAVYFGYSCVNLGNDSRNITVDSCRSLSPKSQITGGRRYSFNNDGQFNLVMNCYASEGRHDFVTGQKVRGPNVFYNGRSENAKSDIGPHHRFAIGTLYDNIVTDGEINIQDRGNWGTGHGWSGITQIVWNCVAKTAAVQDPWVSGKNYVVGLKAKRNEGRLKGRLQTEWEGNNNAAGTLVPASLYLAQINDHQ